MIPKLLISVSSLVFLGGIAQADIHRTLSGKPDFTGNYDSGTLTPLNRPEEFGDKQFMTREEADEIKTREATRRLSADETSNPDREAPPVGGDSEILTGGAGGVGGYNSFWLDFGSDASEIDGQFRTSIVYDPPNGRQPERTPEGAKKLADNFTSFSYQNDGTASWLDKEGPGPFDGPESLALAERCLVGFSAGPPMLPGVYNNFKRIVQTEDHIVILMEMVHDARIIRLNSEHGPKGDRLWLGDSIGWWEDDTLVVDTINFREHTGLYGGDENLHLIEHFSLLENGNLLYDFTVDDPTAWTEQWSGEYAWKKSDEKVYEYACHEGNYAMGNILRGARLLEKETLQQTGAE
ncbi:MAG: hypothetical protein O7E57_00095 [Gammaproteobacteria bacterium]|nr:hypothetical protein [Gammaproteobacteria bacterium]